MKRLFLSLLMAAMAMMASAFVNRYNIISKIDGGAEKACSGTISLSGNKNYEGLVSYSSLTIYINDMVNYEWSLYYKNIIDETTVEMTNTLKSYKLQMKQVDDSTYIFTLPLFYGSKQGNVKYKAVQEDYSAAYRTSANLNSVPTRPSITVVDPSVAAAKAAKAEADRLASAEAAAKKAAEAAAAAKKAEEDAKKARAQNAMQELFGSGSGTGSGSSNPAGSGRVMSNGALWSLAGRGLNGSLAKPAYSSNAEGTVVVAIRVDQNGNVVSATKGAGTNTNDQSLINAAIEAAKKAKFTAGDGVAVGSITYVFKLG